MARAAGRSAVPVVGQVLEEVGAGEHARRPPVVGDDDGRVPLSPERSAKTVSTDSRTSTAGGEVHRGRDLVLESSWFRKTRSRRPRSRIDPTTSARESAGSWRTTGICEIE